MALHFDNLIFGKQWTEFSEPVNIDRGFRKRSDITGKWRHSLSGDKT